MILGICNDADVLSVVKLVKLVITIIRISVPIILIVSCMIELFHAVIKAEVSESLKTVTRKIVAAIIIFLIPTGVDIIFRVLDYEKVYYPCIENSTKEGISAARQVKAESLILLAKNTLLEDYYFLARDEINKMTDTKKQASLTKELNSVHTEIEKAKKERDEREKNKYSKTGTYTRSELMDKDEQAVINMSNEEFIKYVAAMAQDIYHEYGGVLPSITIAQACLESGYGDHFEPTSHNLYGMIGYPSEKPLVTRTRKFENFYEATYYHYKYYVDLGPQYYSEFNKACARKDAFGAASYLWKYANGEQEYPGKIIKIINNYNLTQYDK